MVVGVGAHRSGATSRREAKTLWVVGSCRWRGPRGGQWRLVEDPAAPVRKREGHLWVNFEGECTTTTLTEKGAAAARSCSNSGEGRRFVDRRWTRSKYTRRDLVGLLLGG
jgi:hypothetical protein